MWGISNGRAKRTEESSSSSSSADNGRFVVRHPALRLGLPDIGLEFTPVRLITREREPFQYGLKGQKGKKTVLFLS